MPLTFSIAGGLDKAGAGIAKAGAGIAAAGAMGYAGMLVGPVVIGYVANATPVRTGLLISVALGIVITMLAWPVSAVDVTAPARPVDMARAAHRRWAVYRSSGGPNHGR